MRSSPRPSLRAPLSGLLPALCLAALSAACAEPTPKKNPQSKTPEEEQEPVDPNEPVDEDGDGVPAELDCDDTDPRVYPGVATFDPQDGGLVDVTTQMSGRLVLEEPGTLLLCGVTAQVNIEVRADNVSILGQGSGTILDGGGLGSVISAEGVDGLVIEGLTLRGGLAERGGGLYARGSELRIADVEIRESAAVDGGGAFLADSAVEIESLTLTANQAEDWGGGLLLSANTGPDGDALTILHLVASENTADEGGAIYCANEDDSPASCAFSGAEVRGNEAASEGGALYVQGAYTIEDSVFSENVADESGGAVYATYNGEEASATIRGSTFEDNLSGEQGGALYIAGALNVSDSTFSRNEARRPSISWASGGAIFCAGHGSPVVTSSGFYENLGGWVGAFHFEASLNNNYPSITDTEFVDNTGRYAGAVLFILNNYDQATGSGIDASGSSPADLGNVRSDGVLETFALTGGRFTCTEDGCEVP
jgi:predicted outer membrane repeat protein